MYLSWLPVPVSGDKAFFSVILRRRQWWSSCFSSSCFSSSHSAGGHSCIMTDWDLAFCLRVLLLTRITSCCLLLAWPLRWWFYTYLSHGSRGSHDLITFSIEDHFSHPGYKTYEEVQALLLTVAAAEQYEEVYLFSPFIVLILTHTPSNTVASFYPEFSSRWKSAYFWYPHLHSKFFRSSLLVINQILKTIHVSISHPTLGELPT